MSNSVTGTSHEARTMEYYDRLPKSARQALQDARFDWATRSLLRSFEAGRFKDGKRLAKHIEEIDLAAAVKERKRIWGPHYPIEAITR